VVPLSAPSRSPADPFQAIVEGEPPDLPSEGYSPMARDFVVSCLNKNPKKRHTYPMLLAHPWMKPLTKPETIDEDDEEPSGDEATALATAAADLRLQPGTGDEDVAAWVRDVLDRKKKGLVAAGGQKPALHAAPLDSVSPVGSPMAQ